MSVRRILRPWTQQPQGAARVDHATSLTRDLAFLSNCGVEPRDAVRGLVGTRRGNTPAPVRYPGGAALAQRFSGSNAGDDYGTRQVIPAGCTTYTVLAIGYLPSTGMATLFSQRLGSGGYDQVQMGVGYDYNFLSGAKGRIFLNEYAASMQFGMDTPENIGDNAVHVVVGVRAGAPANGRIYCDGVDLTARTGGAGGSQSSSAQKLRIGNAADHAGTDAEAEGGVAVVAVWTRALSPAEVVAVSANPWQLFAPQEIWVPRSAAGGYTHPTLSNARMIWTGPGAGKPAIDYTW